MFWLCRIFLNGGIDKSLTCDILLQIYRSMLWLLPSLTAEISESCGLR